jgi:hypothetical protein
MGALPTDILIRTALEAAIQDMRRNAYLLNDCFGGLANDLVSKAEYGPKEPAKALEFITKNNIPVFLPFRPDGITVPCVLINQIAASEASNRASLADDGEDNSFDPVLAGRPVHRILPEMNPTYDITNGQLTIPTDHNTYQIAPGMFLVTATGNKYQIQSTIDDQTIQLQTGITEDLRNSYVTPAPNNWLAHREQLFFTESWSITVIGAEPVQAGWLRQFISYCLGRYREAYLEGRGFAISSFQSGPVVTSSVPNCYEAKFTLSGDVEQSWIKYVAPKFTRVEGGIKILDMPKTPIVYEDEAAKQGWSSVNDTFVNTSSNEADIDTFGDATHDALGINSDDIDLLGED